MVEKLHNQEIHLTICPEHQDEQYEGRETIAFLKERYSRKRSKPRIQEDQCRQQYNAD